MTLFKMMGASPSMLARMRTAIEGMEQPKTPLRAAASTQMLHVFLSALRTEIQYVKFDCFGASVDQRAAAFFNALDELFTEAARAPESFMQSGALRDSFRAMNCKPAAQVAKAGIGAIDAEAIYAMRAAQVERARAEPKTAPSPKPLSDDFAEGIYAARRQAVGERDA
jgi:hypothetical protein